MNKLLIGITVAYLAVAGYFIMNPFTLLVALSRQSDVDYATLTGNYDSNEAHALFNNKPVSSPLPKADKQTPDVLGATTAKKQIRVDLAAQKLYAYEGDKKVMEFPISSGKWGRTPTGTFRIWIKFRYALMTGGSQALGTYYYLPNVPYTMYFYNDEIPQSRGFGIHGAYWHDNFGRPMSHGCINMKEEDVEQLYYWTDPRSYEWGNKNVRASADNPGTEIVIYGEAPFE